MSEVILYDIPSRDQCACWSPNPWKTRLLLNYKRIPYKTEWLEYPEIAPTLKSVGLPPNDEGTPYTIPTIRDTNGKYTMDSRKIAAELEKQYPEPSVHLDSPMLPRVEQCVGNTLVPLRAVLMPAIPRNVLREASVGYFERTRQERFGMPLSQFEKDHGGDQAWEAATPGLKDIGHILRAEGGPFVLGKTVSYADFVIVGVLQAFKRVDHNLFERMVKIEPALKDLYDASKAWLERADH